MRWPEGQAILSALKFLFLNAGLQLVPECAGG